LKIKSSLVDTNNHLNQVLPAFNCLNRKSSLGFCLIDNFPDHFVFHTIDCKDAEARTAHHNKLNNIFKDLFQSNNTILIISDTSVKNNIIILVSHIRREHEIIKKTIHHVINIMFTETELFAIRCDISQVSQIQGIIHIIIVINPILATKRIFNIFLHPYQLYSIVISSDFKKFFNKNLNNMISFWDYPNDNKWPLHLLVDKKLKFHQISPILPSKTLWDFSRKEEYDSIVKK